MATWRQRSVLPYDEEVLFQAGFLYVALATPHYQQGATTRTIGQKCIVPRVRGRGTPPCGAAVQGGVRRPNPTTAQGGFDFPASNWGNGAAPPTLSSNCGRCSQSRLTPFCPTTPRSGCEEGKR